MTVLRGKVVLKETSAGIPDLVVEDVHAALPVGVSADPAPAAVAAGAASTPPATTTCARSSATGRAGSSCLALPALFLVIFVSVFTGTIKVAGGSIDTRVYYVSVPGIITLAIISAASGTLGPCPGPLRLHT